MASTAKKITQLAPDGVTVINTFESIQKAVDTLKIARPVLTAACESGEVVEGFKFKMEDVSAEASAKSPDASEEPAEKQITMSESDLAKMLSGVEERLTKKFQSNAPATDMNDFARVLAENLNNNSDGAVKRYAARNEASVDPDDYLAEPVMFFTYLHYFSLHAERRKGHEVLTPFRRPIIFNNISGHISGATRKGTQTVQISAAQITTKSELDWLRKSPKMGIIIHESIGETTVVDHEYATKLMEALTEISALTDHQVLNRALGEGVPASRDIDAMRSQLIKKIADRSIELSKTVSKDAAQGHALAAKVVTGAKVTSY